MRTIYLLKRQKPIVYTNVSTGFYNWRQHNLLATLWLISYEVKLVLNFVYCRLAIGFVILNKNAFALILVVMATEFEEKWNFIEEVC